MKFTDTKQVILYDQLLNMKCYLTVNNANNRFYKQCFGNKIISNYTKVKTGGKPLKIKLGLN
jgi:hypothetical protein